MRTKDASDIQKPVRSCCDPLAGAAAGPRLEAVIEIGATGLRLLIAEISADGSWAVIDRAERALALGRDVFTIGSISRDSLLQCLAILNRYREILRSWAVEDAHVTVVATSAIREAKNRDSILDRLSVKTGFRVRVIDGIEENRLMYLVVNRALRGAPGALGKINSIIMDVGGGSTEIMLMQKGKMVAAHSFRMGTVIIEQQVKAMMGSAKDMRRFLAEYIRTTGETLNKELRLDRVHQLIAISSDARLAARSIGTPVTDLLSVIPRHEFISFVQRVTSYTPEECVRNFRISYGEAESLTPGLLAYQYFLEMTEAETVLVPFLTLREGVIISCVSGPDPLVNEEFYTQVVASAANLGKRYHVDEDHSRYVTRIALGLYNCLEAELGLDRHARLILEVAAILHDVGSFIRPADHHLHSQYIIAHSDIFGLNKDDMNILSNVVRYHRAEKPNPGHHAYATLARQDRTMVLKLSALLRIADALDRGHSQHIEDFDIELSKDTLYLRARGTHDVTLERMALEEKADLFEEIFGYRLVLN
ncbi:HD domain-containing protein [Treponema zuelzerae]|uniref:HD domain-containing protein n=1 Tax=Teretinema zuelzerae TaxID=156 RepID=A0AAE3JKT5_9SPIR|nr:HD domain-containing protein [Teretinema zuelzerae]MBN2810332.1 HD domain-containing protein [Spirochaetales bacterium]MCD1654224.1 HD domain-containing protein [Teretinema zuelzerae]